MLLGRSLRPNKSQPLAYYHSRQIAVLWAGSGHAHAQEYTKHMVLSQWLWLRELEIEVRVMVCKGSECNVRLVIARAVMKRALSSSADSVCTSNVRNHARADQLTHAMNLLKREQAEASDSGSCSFAPIAGALSHLPDEEKEQLRRKFDIAYFIALEKLS